MTIIMPLIFVLAFPHAVLAASRSILSPIKAPSKVVKPIRPVVSVGAISADGRDPQVTLQADKQTLKIGDSVVFTSVVAVPSSELEPMVGVSWTMKIDGRLQVTAVTGPSKSATITNKATVNWHWPDGTVGGPQDSNTVSIDLWSPGGVALPNRPDANGVLTIAVGDLAIGESVTVTVTCKRVA